MNIYVLQEYFTCYSHLTFTEKFQNWAVIKPSIFAKTNFLKHDSIWEAVDTTKSQTIGEIIPLKLQHCWLISLWVQFCRIIATSTDKIYIEKRYKQ